MKVAIIDYNMGNLHSVGRAITHVAPADTQIKITADPDFIRHADRIVFPGQGAARDCMRELETRGLTEVVREVAKTKPFIGICMGMQVLMDFSEENGGVECMGIYAGKVNSFKSLALAQLKTPQMGWNQIQQARPHPLWAGIKDHSRFYFVHSYYVQPEDNQLVTGATCYGLNYASAIAHENLFAIQAHPEKSAADGLQLLANFMHWQP